MRIKKTIFALVLCLCGAAPCFAQNYIEGMRSLTVNALMQYGRELYDRGDFNEARAVFSHVLTFDSHQAQALQYLKDMGYVLPAIVSPVVSPAASPVVNPIVGPKFESPAQVPVPVVPPLIIEEGKPDELSVKVNVLDEESLKRAIEAQKQIIERLKAQIKQMKANLAAESAT